MKTFLVSYDLKQKANFDYTSLIEYIKTYGSWAKPLESFWLIKTDKQAAVIRDEIRTHIKPDDKVVVIEVTGANWATSSVSKEVNDWIHSKM